MEFRQAVDGTGQKIGRRMVELVPARVVRRVVEPEIRTYVEQRRSARDDLGGHLRGHAVGQRGEDRVGLGDRLVDDESGLAQVRMGGRDRSRGCGRAGPPA